ncbi:hypothetical protein NDS46_29085 [Paenibacillus thiaminolyticus]|uniref:hypothetical protein n=1 Tax=Paenibacillus thiaminolyticus TaxID=49283 RepID=UPI00232F9E30|nr:hypothetical protein [Paenibacillus thiaminolyticus]WCF08260.1 hypothetical protein NDS46_29085 [Paenibacillus thiaminolyticus]
MNLEELTAYGQIVGTIGFPSLVALILLKQLLGSFNERLDKLDTRLEQLNKTMVMLAKTGNQMNKEYEFVYQLIKRYIDDEQAKYVEGSNKVEKEHKIVGK